MEHCGIWNRCTLGFMKLLSYLIDNGMCLTHWPLGDLNGPQAKLNNWWLQHILWKCPHVMWLSLDLTDDKSTLVQVLAWCHQATIHYPSQVVPVLCRHMAQIRRRGRGRVTHICVGKLIIIGSDNGLSPDRRQAIIRTNARLLSIGPLRTHFNENLIKIQQFLLKKMHVKMSSAKWRPTCLGLNVKCFCRCISTFIPKICVMRCALNPVEVSDLPIHMATATLCLWNTATALNYLQCHSLNRSCSNLYNFHNFGWAWLLCYWFPKLNTPGAPFANMD